MEVVTINWNGPYLLHDLETYETSTSSGIYAISRVWGGNETLLYIGKTTRTFFQRMNEHNRDWFMNVRGEIRFRFGVTQFEDGKKYSKKKLGDIEALLICYHKPQENTMSMNYYWGREELVVLNKGQKGSFMRAKVSSIDDFVNI